jgi:hypothetical protein
MDEVPLQMNAASDSEAPRMDRPHVPSHTAREPEQSRLPSWFALTDGGWRPVARFLIAAGLSIVVCAVLGRFAAPSLTAPADIVGFATFNNFNFEAQFWVYRLVVYAFPFFAIVGYVLLARFGPLRSCGPRPAKRRVELIEPAPAASPMKDEASWDIPVRVLLPSTVVVVACGARTGHMDALALAAGVVYATLVVAVAESWARRGDAQRWRALAAVNGVGGAVAVVLSIWFVSAHTVVRTVTGTRSWPWLIWWVPVLGVIAIVWWAARQLRNGRAARDVELTLLTVVVGAVALFLAISVLPGQITFFQGYDDAQEMAGASLFARGYFPWRDVLFVHGLFPDVLTGSLGRAIFGDSIWGVVAIHTVVLIPLFWVSTYLFGVWVSRRNPWFLAAVFLCVVLGLGPLLEWERSMGEVVPILQWPERFLGAPIVFIVLGETLRRRSVKWVTGLTLLLFVEEILVPETVFVVATALPCVVAADIVHRRSEQNLWTNLRLTRWCVGTGLAAVAVWAAFLAAFGALRAFIDYYVVVGAGHNLWGAMPPTVGVTELMMLAVDIACVLLTVWAVAVKVASRADWQARDWVAVAAAAFVALYTEKAIGRFDPTHVWQVFGASLPLVLLWSWRLLSELGRLVGAWWHERDARLVGFAQPITAVVIPVIVLGFVSTGPLRVVSGQHLVSGVAEAKFARLGYAAPGAIDTDLLHDLETSIRAYAGDDGPVFDMTLSLGYIYFLLGRAPGTRFTHADLAVSQYAQRMLIDDLKAARPPVVIYDSTSIGVPAFDGITGNVRSYEVSEYVLRGWTPVLRTHGVLVMVRNDLVNSRPLPALTTPPQTTDLYFSGPSCDWGATPNYLPVPDTDRATTLPVRSTLPRTVVHYTGWAVDPSTNLPAREVVFADGDRVVGTARPTIERPDIAEVLHQGVREMPGGGLGGVHGNPDWKSGFTYDAVFDGTVAPSAYLVGADGLVHPLGASPAGSVTALRLPDGGKVEVAPTVAGSLEVRELGEVIGEVQFPSGMTPRDYDVVVLSSVGGHGGGHVALTDQPGRPYHNISARWLDQTGPRLTLRVGSCPQWYGYDPSKPLYIVQPSGKSVSSVALAARR